MTFESLRELVCTKFLGGDLDFPIDEETDLVEEGICDSLALVQLAADIEERLDGIKIFDAEITRENFGSIAAMMAFVQAKQSGAGG